ncbi:DEAD/DEAH box helicase [Egibacter rhizosphaerae]|uniref:DEAD/DEAH box helicase n=1 Tax=Egibacter rhizosphaerae TaxID=1670831 RepID=UPI00197A8829|nr:DEAD/DEAH box helicase [Egibacter rhizosphaerae]
MSQLALPGRLQATFWPGGRVPSDGHLALWGVDDLEAAATAHALPGGATVTLPTVLPRTPRARTRVVTAEVPALLIPVLPAARALAAWSAPADWPPWQRPADSLLAWSVAAKIALEVVAAGGLVPTLRPAGPDGAVASWRLVPPRDGRWEALGQALPPAAHALPDDADEAAVWSPVALFGAFGDAVADACGRALDGPVAAGASASRSWVAGLIGPDPLVTIDGAQHGSWDDAVDHGPAEDGLAAQVSAWAAPLIDRDAPTAARLCLRLDTPVTDEPDAPWRVDYLLQAADDPSLLVPADQVWDAHATTLEALGRHVGDPQESLVRGLAEAARLFPPVERSLAEPRPAGLELDTEEAAQLLTDRAGELAAADVGVLLPAELTASGARRLRARMRVYDSPPDPGKGITDAGLDEETIASFEWEVALGDDTISARELAEIAAMKSSLVRWRGQWVRVDPDEAPRLADIAGQQGELSGVEAIAIALSGEREVDELGEVEVIADGALADLVADLRAGESGPGEPRLDGITAELRPYQRRGVAWLQALADRGLGALLADDMGLGKTLQTIALLADRAGERPSLVVCPTSVVGNWERELARFAPHLEVVRHHGGERAGYAAEVPAGAVVVTSYGLVRRDIDLLADVAWECVVLDEAQQVKNPSSQGAQAVRRLESRHRVALTGTPVENRLSELWSVLDFANPGLLGPFARFKERYAVPVERWRDPDATARLRRLTAPFLLRRAKTDASVAADLPAKHEVDVSCTLTREQATLYQAAVATILDDEGLGEGIERRGRVLKLLMALKQICNHPAQYLGEDGGTLAGRSGKLDRTAEMLAEITDNGARALVFTQFREMGELLARQLQAALGLADVPFLHGGVAQPARDRMVERFQTDPSCPPVLLVSLKAGGTGLNLTAATHVVHYDRWWNPAVEDQATDRAYRIGQSREVTAHKLVTAGTLEERIAALLEDKRALADAVVGEGEAWLTELSDAELRELVELSDVGSGSGPREREPAA